MNVLSTILNIIIFLLCLSTVVCIHEAGHLVAAKSFKVYCYEYSIGFGHKIVHKRFRHKRKKPLYDSKNEIQQENVSVMVQSEPKKEMTEQQKKVSAILDSSVETKEEKEDPNYYFGETYFSIGVLPLGGYVAMAGEDNEDNGEGIVVPKERTLTGINHAKQIVIMMAGIMMNFILALVLFFADFAFCEQTKANTATNEVSVSEKLDKNVTAAYQAGLRTGDKILTLYQTYDNLYDKDGEKVRASLDFPKESQRKDIVRYVNDDATTADTYAQDSLAFAIQDVIAHNSDTTLKPIEGFEGMQINSDSTRTIHFTYYSVSDDTTKSADAVLKSYKASDGTWTFEKFGISAMTEKFRYSVSDAFILTGKQFHELFVGIYKALGSLFTPSGWKNMGGIISVYRVSAQGVSSGSIGYFLLLWGYISLNLGCFNLLPFPGLDGWQTLIALIESITRKKFPNKAKGIANMIGMILLFALAGLLLFKDIFVR